jgi:hypothetical protein
MRVTLMVGARARVTCLILLGIAASCARATPVSQLRPISPDEPDYCDHCPCHPGGPHCPMHLPSLCSLSGLWASQRLSFGEPGVAVSPTIFGAWACGKYVVVDELCGTDCGGEYAYEASTGCRTSKRMVG